MWSLLVRSTLALIAALALGCRAAPAPAPPLRVMTWNIAAGAGGLDSIAATIRGLAPDIVALQEVDVHWSERSAFADQATVLARDLGMEMRFGPIYHVAAGDGRPPREFGVAILSRHPIVASTNHAITRHSTQAPDAAPRPMPGFLEATIDVRGIRVRVFDTHLDYRPDRRVRGIQVREMIGIIGDTKAPILLLGDLNAPPEAPELRPLLERLRDAWPGGTGTGLTYPADAPTKRIDYVLVSEHFRVASARVVRTEASDHLPVLTAVVLRR